MAGTMVLFAGLFFYAMIIPLDEERQSAENNQANIQNQLNEMKTKLEGKDITSDRAAQTAALEQERERFTDLLPRREELVKFITGLSETAKAAGLQLRSFAKDQPNEQDFYLEIPIHMKVTGSYRQLLGFLRAISMEDQRIVNIRNFSLKRVALPVDEIVMEYETRRKEETPEGVAVRPLSELQKMMQIVRAHEEAASRGVELEAEFTAYVFSYTGQPASAEAAAKNQSARESRLNRRRKNLIIL